MPSASSSHALTLPLPLRAINVLGRAAASVGLRPGPLRLESCLEQAQEATGLDDFGRDDFRAPLGLLLDELAGKATELNLTGRLGFAREIQRLLVNRLRIQAQLARHPEILDETLTAPLFVVGSPRTGTTLLHNLLARLPGATTPALWELLEPAPRELGKPPTPDPRIASAQRFQREIELVLPQVQTLHPMAWDWPEECLWMFANSGLSELFLARLHLPRYAAMLMHCDWSWAVEEYRQTLQLLQWQRGRPLQWVLKAPGHMFRLEALRAAFPDARFIRTHRDPCKTIASICSLFELGRVPAERHVDPRAVGEQVLATWVDVGLTRLVEASSQLEPASTFDIDFRQLMADPFALIARMWAHFELPAYDDSNMRAWLADNPRNRRGTHRYSLEHYGIGEDEALARTRDYRAHFAAYL